MSQSDDRDDALETYRYLRGGLVVLVLALAVGVGVDRVRGSCLEASISAYYFTSAHSVFIGVLCAAGALLVIYGGSSGTEDVLLSLAGILAVVVALVPTGRPPILCGPGGLPAIYDTHAATATNIWTLSLTLAVAGLTRWITRRRKAHRQNGFRLLALLCTVLSAVVLAGGFVVFVTWPDVFDRFAHGVAAVGMFLAISATVGVTALLARRQHSTHHRRYFAAYVVIFGSMVATTVTVVVLHVALGGWNHWVLALETLLLIEFTIYWAVQTVELWNVRSRGELLPEPERTALAARPGTRGPIAEARDVMATPKGQRLFRAI